jgi:hypothetical protein
MQFICDIAQGYEDQAEWVEEALNLSNDAYCDGLPQIDTSIQTKSYKLGVKAYNISHPGKSAMALLNTRNAVTDYAEREGPGQEVSVFLHYVELRCQ